MSVQEQKIILYLVSKVKYEDEDFKEYETSMQEICDVLGIQRHGQNYADIKKKLLILRNKTVEIKNNRRTDICGWIEQPSVYDNGMITFMLHKSLKPYLLQLKKEFTSYELINVLPMDSTYSIRLYELLKSYANLGSVILDIEELKKSLFISSGYEIYNNFKMRILEVAKQEINKYTDLRIEYKPLRISHKYTKIRFEIKKGVRKKL